MPFAGGGLQYHDARGASSLNLASGTSSGVQGDTPKVNSMKNVRQGAAGTPCARGFARIRCTQMPQSAGLSCWRAVAGAPRQRHALRPALQLQLVPCSAAAHAILALHAWCRRTAG